ncbi:MAG: FAD-binding oxidoreductase [Planctomycetes bacterium]|nr:FAD-binding oxidoreductase [Planctomycetota bacterium]
MRRPYYNPGVPERLKSYWELTLPVRHVTATSAPASVDVLIVGAGFLGLWLAYFLSARKNPPRILVVERDTLGYGASSRNAGFLTCGHISEIVSDLAESPREAVFAAFLRRKQGVQTILNEFPDLLTDPCGSADYDPITDEKRALADELNATLASRGEPPIYDERELVFGGKPRRAFFNRFDRGVHPVRLLKALHERCAAHGVTFAHGVEVMNLGDGSANVVLADGKPAKVKYGRAFICTNAFARQLNAATEIVPGRGQVIITTPVEAKTSHALGFLNDGYDYFKFVDGRLLIGGGRHMFREREETTDLTPSVEVRNYLQALARQVIGHDRFSVERHWAGIMGFKSGAHVSLTHETRIDARTSELHACGGMGVALSPVVAQQTAANFP